VTKRCEACRGTGRQANYNYQGERIMGSYECIWCQGTGKVQGSASLPSSEEKTT